ncbi:MAG TPA: pilus assembly protein N-terminal domain-containing protein [Rhizomicrobium sp.]|jgi:Flp pilus assembly secretin CpaC|nr:pilus assembly protein N-terminal domain-containing protein [Rhizomicrobium sp.]
MRHSLAAFVFGLSCTSALAAGGVSVPMDEVRTVTFGKPVTTVYVGNPVIADINMIDSRHAFVLGKSFGTTNIIALDSTGREVSNTFVSVSGTRGATVTLTKGTAQTTLACSNARCESAPLPGDAHFSDIMGDIEKHIDLGGKTAQ